MTYSQGREDEIIAAHFGARVGARVGRFLEIGAFDGRANSNTLALVERGWSGVCVEADPKAFCALLERHGGNPRLQLVHALIAPALIGLAPGLATFHLATDASVSTTDERHRERWKEATSFRPISMQVTPVADLLTACPGPYDFVSIDTEGTSDVIAAALPLTALGVSLLCVEYGYEPAALARRLREQGFRQVARLANNEMWARS